MRGWLPGAVRIREFRAPSELASQNGWTLARTMAKLGLDHVEPWFTYGYLCSVK